MAIEDWVAFGECTEICVPSGSDGLRDYHPRPNQECFVNTFSDNKHRIVMRANNKWPSESRRLIDAFILTLHHDDERGEFLQASNLEHNRDVFMVDDHLLKTWTITKEERSEGTHFVDELVWLHIPDGKRLLNSLLNSVSLVDSSSALKIFNRLNTEHPEIETSWTWIKQDEQI